jgi:hypothetical protein
MMNTKTCGIFGLGLLLLSSCAPAGGNRTDVPPAGATRTEASFPSDETMLNPSLAADWLEGEFERRRKEGVNLIVLFKGTFEGTVIKSGKVDNPPSLTAESRMRPNRVTFLLEANGTPVLSSSWTRDPAIIKQQLLSSDGGEVAKEYQGPFNPKADPEFPLGDPPGVRACGLVDHLARGWLVEGGFPEVIAELIRKAEIVQEIEEGVFEYLVQDAFPFPDGVGLYSYDTFIRLNRTDPAIIISWDEVGDEYGLVKKEPEARATRVKVRHIKVTRAYTGREGP